MGRREFLQLAQNIEDHKSFIYGWFCSIKLDGQRAFWDGGVSRGLFAKDVPWANTRKDSRLLIEPIATGLWSRYGKVIHAPDWWLDALPAEPLDGELYMGPKMFQELRSCVSEHEPGPWWDIVKFHIYEMPTYQQVFEDGEIKNENFHKVFEWSAIRAWLLERGAKGVDAWPLTFDFVVKKIAEVCGGRVTVAHPQERLPDTEPEAREAVRAKALEVTQADGEGLMLRHPSSVWTPKRVTTMLKVKPLLDAEGTVMGFCWGRKTNRGSKLLGKVGALIVKLDDGIEFELSGFTDEERRAEMRDGVEVTPGVTREPLDREGKQASDKWAPSHFPLGSRVTFTYREMSDDGKPKEARFLRARSSE